MSDISTLVPHVAHHVHHLPMAVAAVAAVPPITTGVSMLTTLISSAVSGGVMFGLGWYIKGRGMTGVKNDINNIKTDVENLKAKVMPSAQAPAVA